MKAAAASVVLLLGGCAVQIGRGPLQAAQEFTGKSYSAMAIKYGAPDKSAHIDGGDVHTWQTGARDASPLLRCDITAVVRDGTVTEVTGRGC